MNNKKIVLITGCSTGIGRATADLLSKSGYTVIATARNLESIKDLEASKKLELDVTNEESIKLGINEVIKSFGNIDVLINNAGYMTSGAIEELDVDAVKKMFDVNVNGILRLVKHIAPIMRNNKSGEIINIGSIAGKFTFPVDGAYSATKFAVEAISDAMRQELRLFNIRVVLVEPGPVKTNFINTAKNKSEYLIENENSPYSDLYKKYKEKTALMRKSEFEPIIVANTILKILKSEKPKTRYQTAVPIFINLLKFVGDRGRDYIARSVFGLK